MIPPPLSRCVCVKSEGVGRKEKGEKEQHRGIFFVFVFVGGAKRKKERGKKRREGGGNPFPDQSL